MAPLDFTQVFRLLEPYSVSKLKPAVEYGLEFDTTSAGGIPVILEFQESN